MCLVASESATYSRQGWETKTCEQTQAHGELGAWGTFFGSVQSRAKWPLFMQLKHFILALLVSIALSTVTFESLLIFSPGALSHYFFFLCGPFLPNCLSPCATLVVMSLTSLRLASSSTCQEIWEIFLILSLWVRIYFMLIMSRAMTWWLIVPAAHLWDRVLLFSSFGSFRTTP